jgi:hypothetical protein
MPQRSIRQSHPSTDLNPTPPAQPTLVEPGESALTSSAQSADTNPLGPGHRMSARDMLFEGGRPYCEFLVNADKDETEYRRLATEAAERHLGHARCAEEDALTVSGLTARHLAFAIVSVQAQAEDASRFKETPEEKRQARRDVWGPFCQHFGLRPVETATKFISVMNRWSGPEGKPRIKAAMRRTRELADRHGFEKGQEVPRTERGVRKGTGLTVSLSLSLEGRQTTRKITRETLQTGIQDGPSPEALKTILQTALRETLGEQFFRDMLNHPAQEEAAVNGS